MKQMGYKDEILNKLKLEMYDWNLDNAVTYYQQDNFCHLYYVGGNGDRGNAKYGCLQKSGCQLKHNGRLRELIDINNPKYNPQLGEFLCMYLIYTNKRLRLKNPLLYYHYGRLLCQTGSTIEDSTKSLRYLSKAKNIDYNFYHDSDYTKILQDKIKRQR